jgi:peptide-methionine (S)-S-oxide reductase
MTQAASVPSAPQLEQATLGGGCFWCLEPVFSDVDGVVAVECGYTNGDVKNPTYEQVCSGDTGHAEVVRVSFDPQRVSFRTLLGIFFSIHNPTTLNRQGNDAGTQYRSGIYTHNEAQAFEAGEVIGELTQEQVFDAPIVTEVLPVASYYPAEEYHQRYYERNPHQGYCAYVVAPKVAKFRKQFASYRKQS